MRNKLKEVASWLIGAVLLSVCNIGVLALPANADPAAPYTLVNYESNQVGMSGWSNVLAYSDAAGTYSALAWGNYVNSS
ncbi:MAG: hypothetical protein RLZZ579_179, partial [Actinomycetota bacterium]